MAFQIEELLRLLKVSEKQYSLDEIAGMTKKSVRSIVDYKNRKAKPKPKHTEDMLTQLAPKAVNHCGLPWSLAAQHQVNAIIALDRSGATDDLERFHEFSIRQFGIELASVDPEKIGAETWQENPDLWGKVLVSYFYLRSVWMNADATKQAVLTPEWTHVIAVFKALLSTQQDEPWVRILRNKIISAEFAILWNSLDPKSDARASDEVKNTLAELDVYNVLIAYNDFVPVAREAPWSATCIASRFKEREKYPDLYKRLSAAEPAFQSREGIQALKQKDRDFDEDFEDFLAWIEENKHDLFRKGAA